MTQHPAGIEERPVWFGPEGRPLAGWITAPGLGAARGGVVLCPTLGREARAGRRALRALARALAASGLVALRFDYDGTGDSGGAFEDPERDVAWTSSVTAAVDLLRDSGLGWVGGIGIRLGATVLGAAMERAELGLDAAVFWDPCESGRSYLREQGALESLRREVAIAAGDGSVETAEHVFPPEMAAELRALRVPDLARHSVAKRVLIVSRVDRPVSERLRGAFGEAHVTWRTTTEQAALLGVDPLFARMPDATIDVIVDWLLRSVPEPGEYHEPKDAFDVDVDIEVDATTVHERCVRIGDRSLFGIITEPTAGAVGPLLILLNVSNEDHTGPSRLWVELARTWATEGLRSIRFDLTGVGDSPLADGQPQEPLYERPWMDDMAAVARELSPAAPSDVVFVGLCSGAFLAAEGARTLAARGVCLINPPVGIDFLHGVTALEASSRPVVPRLAPLLKQFALRLRWVSVGALAALRLGFPRTFGRDVLGELVDAGTEVFVLASREDLSPYPSRPRLERFFSRRLVEPRNYRVTFVPGLDHSMHASVGRARTIALLDAHVRNRYVEHSPQMQQGDHDPKEQP